MRDIEVLKEEVVIEYLGSYDLEIAMMKCNLTSDEKKLLKDDASFMYRIDYQNALIREDIVTVMIVNLKGPDAKLSQKAAIDLGNLLWKEKFKTNNEAPKGVVPDSIVLVGEGPDK
jgi:hypothetical protein